MMEIRVKGDGERWWGWRVFFLQLIIGVYIIKITKMATNRSFLDKIVEELIKSKRVNYSEDCICTFPVMKPTISMRISSL